MASDPKSFFLRNILRTHILNYYDHIGDFKGGIISDGEISLFSWDPNDDTEYFQETLNFGLRLRRIFEIIREIDEDIFFSWVFNLIKKAEPIDIANLISIGFLYDLTDERPEELIATLEKCSSSALTIFINARDYICEDENFYHSERDILHDRFCYIAKFFTRKLIYKIILLYEKSNPSIQENIDSYGWRDADFNPDNYKKLDEF